MPIALALPEVLLVVAVALLLVVLLVNVQLYQNGHQARSFALNLPVVANPVVSAVDWLIGFNVQAARLVDTAIETVLVLSAQALANLIVAVVNIAGAGLIALTHNAAATASSALSLARSIELTELPAVGARVRALENLEGVVSAQVRAAIAAAIVVALAPLNAALDALGATQRADERVISIYRPLWDSLAALPNGAAQTIIAQGAAIATLTAQVGVLQRELVNVGSGVSSLERQVALDQATVAKLTALLTLAGAGAIAIAEILRIARNPCEVCQGLNLNDLEARVASMELAGV